MSLSAKTRTAIAGVTAFTALSATAALALAAVAAPAASNDPELVVRTDRGAVRGLAEQDTRTFRGIPYAAPPTGEWRWRSPRAADRWSGVRDATQYAGSCAQGEHPVGVASTSEDCLYLDVTTPTSARGLPVVVWIHGGSFTNGATRNYGPSRLAKQGKVVVVQVHYRLGAFGFL